MARDPHVESQAETTSRAAASTERDPQLPNLLRLTPRIIIGGEPQGDEAFAKLKRLGVVTVVSVDGARPQLQSAKRHGLAYVHIPLGYEGINSYASLALTRLVRDQKGPFYIHCHHGQHRAPAAAAVACIAAGDMDNNKAIGILRRAGTSPHFSGLWRDVANYRPPPPNVDLPALVEVAQVTSMAAAMAQIDRTKDNLSLSLQNQWSTPSDHPNIIAVNEALLLRELLYETRRNLSDDFDEDFRTSLKETETHAKRLEIALKESRYPEASAQFSALTESCNKCHAQYRD